ncbi:MAG: hypothetical protein OEO19_13755 [Gammaproteobacteria bacterium]|nr:hypothetical protein [Gammaproteobacteria bacterium]MDH3446957.1 hypothetical protein [Gammaproteobacteria bacterium]
MVTINYNTIAEPESRTTGAKTGMTTIKAHLAKVLIVLALPVLLVLAIVADLLGIEIAEG